MLKLGEVESGISWMELKVPEPVLNRAQELDRGARSNSGHRGEDLGRRVGGQHILELRGQRLAQGQGFQQPAGQTVG